MNYLFDKIWFEKWQKQLLWLLNAPVIKYWFRYILRIHNDLSFDKKIIEIQPNNYKWYEGLFLTKEGLRHICKADVRTHNKFSKRLLYAFYPIWWLFHQWDILIANKFYPSLNLSFDTLTAFPDPNPETTSFDGWVGRLPAAENWASIRGGAGTDVDDVTDPYSINTLVSTTANNFTEMSIGMYLFDTSSLGAGATISAATMSLRGTTKTNGFATDFAFNVYGITTASNTAASTADYANRAGTAFSNSTIAISAYSTTGYNDWAFNASGISAISLTSISKFCIRNTNDVNNTDPWEDSKLMDVRANNAEAAGTSTDPKIVITYTPAATFFPKIIIM